MSHTNMVLGSWRRDEWPEYVTVSHDGMREPGRRYVPERTCRNFGGEEGTVGEGYDFACSACGWCGDVTEPNYFPSCGARVVVE